MITCINYAQVKLAL